MYAELTSWNNLLVAYRRAAKGKRGHANVATFEYQLEDELLALQNELRAFTYQPGPYRSFYIHEPKRRLISAAPFRDRVVHHALCQLIEPRFERSFSFDSYANRVGKGAHRALNRAQTFARRYPYVLQCDVRQFFPSLDHAILQAALARKVTDDHVRWLIGRILASGDGIGADEYAQVYFPGDTLWDGLRPRGLPIGNLTSQFWANVYLNAFDHFVKRELGCHAYVRYVDDFLLFAGDLPTLHRGLAAIHTRLARFRLTLHPHAHPTPVSAGIPFLGFVLYPDRRRLKRRKGLYFARRLRRLASEFRHGTRTFADISVRVAGWVNHTRYANTTGLREAVLGSVTFTS